MTTRFIKNALFTGIPFGIAMGVIFSAQHGTIVGISTSLLCGVLFGLAMAGFMELQRRKLEAQSSEFKGAELLLQGPANHFLKYEGRGGWLTLTSEKLAFRPHGKNIQNRSLDILLSDIKEVTPARTMGLIPNGLRIELKDSDAEKFVVSGRMEWIGKIEELLG